MRTQTAGTSVVQNKAPAVFADLEIVAVKIGGTHLMDVLEHPGFTEGGTSVLLPNCLMLFHSKWFPMCPR